MALMVEIHFPAIGEEEWVDDVGDFLIDLEDEFGIEEYEDGEQVGDDFVFFISGRNERTLLKAASQVALRKGVPAGAYAMVTDTAAAEVGLGRRVSLPVR